MKIIKTTNGIENIEPSQKIVSLIGPTGVGKTTTAAKICSEQILQYKRKVALITVDTMRIAAVEQLRAYAKVINVPLSIVSDKVELDRPFQVMRIMMSLLLTPVDVHKGMKPRCLTFATFLMNAGDSTIYWF